MTREQLQAEGEGGMKQYDGLTEALITINGRTLTFAQSMTVRVAIGGFLIELSDSDYAAKLGPIADAYRARALEVQDAIIDGATK